MPTTNPTRAAQVLDFLATFTHEHGYPPSVRQVATGCGVALTTAHYWLGRLEKLGFITREPGAARAIRLVY